MSVTAKSKKLDIEDIRDLILCDPEIVLDDHDIMKALIAANEERTGKNIIDLRGITMDRLETNFDRLEDTHRTIVTAAYENLAGTNQIHRALLSLLDARSISGMLAALSGDVADILRVDAVAMVMEIPETERHSAELDRFRDILLVKDPGFSDNYIRAGRDITPRQVTLRQITNMPDGVFGGRTNRVNSEAVLRLDFGAGRLPGLLVLGAGDIHQFRANQGTDLLTFFADAVGRVMRHCLS